MSKNRINRKKIKLAIKKMKKLKRKILQIINRIMAKIQMNKLN